MARPDWDERYRTDELPWDTGEPDEHLVAFVGGGVGPGRALDVGCGTGTNAVWLAEQGFEVVGIDLAPTAIERARARAAAAAGVAERCRFAVLDFLAEGLDATGFDLVFDRGCFHVFDEPAERARFAECVAGLLAPGGLWLSLIGSTEGPERDHGPPRRTARDVVTAIEPVLEVVQLETRVFRAKHPELPRAWVCVSRPREVPAQPSTKR